MDHIATLDPSKIGRANEITQVTIGAGAVSLEEFVAVSRYGAKLRRRFQLLPPLAHICFLCRNMSLTFQTKLIFPKVFLQELPQLRWPAYV